MQRLLILGCFFTSSVAFGAIEEFLETFDGDGPYDTNDGRFTGLDNPGWMIEGTRDHDIRTELGELRDGGYAFDNNPRNAIALIDYVWRDIPRNSFVERVELRDFHMALHPDPLIAGTSNLSLGGDY